MAYDKHTWTCNEPITVERLNHIEDGIANAGGDCGYECEETITLLTEETVTTELEGNEAYGDFSYSQLIDADSITVTFDGVEYECEVNYYDGEYSYGALYDDNLGTYDWSEYPFAVSSFITDSPHTTLCTQTAGTYTIKIEVEEEIITTTPCFDKARGYSCGEEMGVLTEESVTTSLTGSRVKGFFSYTEPINANSIVVTFNGTEYECDRRDFFTNSAYIYGGEYSPIGTDFSTYPFIIISPKGSDDAVENVLYTETEGTYNVKIGAMQEVVTTTQCFEKAVKSIAGGVVYAHMTRAYDSATGCTTYTLDITDDDVRSIINAGQRLVIVQSTIKGDAIYNPTFMSAIGATAPILRAGVGGVSAVVMVTVQDDDENERLLTLSVRSGTASPRYLKGELCGSTSSLTVELDKNISEATESSPVSSVTASVHDGIMDRLEQGVAVYLQEGGNNRKHLITSYHNGNGNMQDSTITVSIEKDDSTLGITYSKPIMFFFDSDGRCYYPASAT